MGCQTANRVQLCAQQSNQLYSVRLGLPSNGQDSILEMLAPNKMGEMVEVTAKREG